MVQLAIEGMNPMPKEYTPVPTLPKVPQLFMAGAVALRPPGMVMLPPLMNADMAPGFVSVRVIVEFATGNTLVGAKATVIDGAAAARPVPLSEMVVGLVGALELTVIVPVIAPIALGAKIRFSTQVLPGAILIGEPVLGAPPANEPKPHQWVICGRRTQYRLANQYRPRQHLCAEPDLLP